MSTTVLLFIPLIATVAQRFEAGRASAGDKVGARLISDAALTAGAEFWAAMPMATAARDDFAIVSASLWLHGDTILQCVARAASSRELEVSPKSPSKALFPRFVTDHKSRPKVIGSNAR